jgi:glycosyltransferase involved in cell wall biosynthesis
MRSAQKMSICFLTNAYPDTPTSYRGIFIKKMATLLREQGHRITVVTPRIYPNSPCMEEQDGVRIYRFPFLAGGKLLIEYDRVPYCRMILYYISGLFFALYAIRKNKCRLIHAHWAIPTGLLGAIAGQLLRKPLVVTVHGSDLRMASGRSSLLRNLFVYVCKKARQVTCVSEKMRKEMETMGAVNGEISMFPMGVAEVFFQARRHPEDVASSRSVTVVSNRNLLPLYDVALLIRAIPNVINQVPAARFVIAGDGSERAALQKEAASLGAEGAVQFLGRVSQETMAALLAGSDIYVSTSPHDGTSVSLLEAMACGAFPIVTDIPANREWITQGENGFLIASNNEVELASRIVEAIRNRGLMEETRKENRKRVEQRARWSVILDRVSELYALALCSP